MLKDLDVIGVWHSEALKCFLVQGITSHPEDVKLKFPHVLSSKITKLCCLEFSVRFTGTIGSCAASTFKPLPLTLCSLADQTQEMRSLFYYRVKLRPSALRS
jgi:hypothetical protein